MGHVSDYLTSGFKFLFLQL